MQSKVLNLSDLCTAPSYHSSETTAEANSHCLKAFCFNDRDGSTCRSRSFKEDTYTVNTACQTALILQNKHSERWRAGDSWKLLNRHDGKHSARVCGAGLWKCFLRSSNRLHQNSIRVRGAPAAFFSTSFKKFSPLNLKLVRSAAKQFSHLQIQRSFTAALRKWGFGAGAGGSPVRT